MSQRSVVCMLGTPECCAEMAEPIEMPFFTETTTAQANGGI